MDSSERMMDLGAKSKFAFIGNTELVKGIDDRWYVTSKKSAPDGSRRWMYSFPSEENAVKWLLHPIDLGGMDETADEEEAREAAEEALFQSLGGEWSK